MIIDLESVLERHKITPKGVIHIGAHIGQEYELYEKLNIENILFFEPNPYVYPILFEKVKNFPNVTTYNCALGDFNGTTSMNIEFSNQGQSSSILNPKKHLDLYPHITFPEKVEIEVFKFDDLDIDTSLYNIMNIDVQGYELKVLTGAEKCLKNIDIIITEVNIDEVDEGCPNIDEIDVFLKQNGFTRRETNLIGALWGDAVYIKDKNNNYGI